MHVRIYGGSAAAAALGAAFAAFTEARETNARKTHIRQQMPHIDFGIIPALWIDIVVALRVL